MEANAKKIVRLNMLARRNLSTSTSLIIRMNVYVIGNKFLKMLLKLGRMRKIRKEDDNE
jgi:hypothetical protein